MTTDRPEKNGYYKVRPMITTYYWILHQPRHVPPGQQKHKDHRYGAECQCWPWGWCCLTPAPDKAMARIGTAHLHVKCTVQASHICYKASNTANQQKGRAYLMGTDMLRACHRAHSTLITTAFGRQCLLVRPCTSEPSTQGAALRYEMRAAKHCPLINV